MTSNFYNWKHLPLRLWRNWLSGQQTVAVHTGWSVVTSRVWLILYKYNIHHTQQWQNKWCHIMTLSMLFLHLTDRQKCPSVLMASAWVTQPEDKVRQGPRLYTIKISKHKSILIRNMFMWQCQSNTWHNFINCSVEWNNNRLSRQKPAVTDLILVVLFQHLLLSTKPSVHRQSISERLASSIADKSRGRTRHVGSRTVAIGAGLWRRRTWFNHALICIHYWRRIILVHLGTVMQQSWLTAML